MNIGVKVYKEIKNANIISVSPRFHSTGCWMESFIIIKAERRIYFAKVYCINDEEKFESLMVRKRGFLHWLIETPEPVAGEDLAGYYEKVKDLLFEKNREVYVGKQASRRVIRKKELENVLEIKKW